MFVAGGCRGNPRFAVYRERTSNRCRPQWQALEGKSHDRMLRTHECIGEKRAPPDSQAAHSARSSLAKRNQRLSPSKPQAASVPLRNAPIPKLGKSSGREKGGKNV